MRGVAIWVSCVVALAFALLAVEASSTPARASEGGRVLFSGHPDTGRTCAECHSSTGSATEPSIDLELATPLRAGESSTAMLRITGGPGVTAGAGVSAAHAALRDGQGTRVEAGELTHTAPIVFNDGIAEVEFEITPDGSQPVELWVSVVSSDDSRSPDGDAVANTSITLPVDGAAAPPATPTPADRPSGPVSMTLALVADGLSVPTNVLAWRNDTLLVSEKPGRIRRVSPDGRVSDPLLDITSRVADHEGELGLLGLVLHPDVDQNRWLYVNYTHVAPSSALRTRISRFTFRSDFSAIEPDSEVVLYEFTQDSVNHNGGQLLFDQSGMLLVATGDGGGARDPQRRAQDLTTPLGKVLRLDVASTSGGADPGCGTAAAPFVQAPPDNPLVGRPDACPEIWDWGLRNPWRMSIDAPTNTLWIADVGQGAREEINVEPTGRGGNNYGWRCREGSTAQANDPECASATLVDPDFEYRHTNGRCSITGGHVYRGTALPDLVGRYVFADLCTGEFFAATPGDGATRMELPTSLAQSPITFGADDDGELLVATARGQLFRIEPERPPEPAATATPVPTATATPVPEPTTTPTPTPTAEPTRGPTTTPTPAPTARPNPAAGPQLSTAAATFALRVESSCDTAGGRLAVSAATLGDTGPPPVRFGSGLPQLDIAFEPSNLPRLYMTEIDGLVDGWYELAADRWTASIRIDCG